MSKLFGYYDDWKTAKLTCDVCGWQGTFAEGVVEEYEQLMDSSCPNCYGHHRSILAIVSYPSIAESYKNWDKLPDIEKVYVEKLEQFQESVRSTESFSVDDLPDLPGDTFTVIWDLEEDERGMYVTAIRAQLKTGEPIDIHREIACWEGYPRFKQVARILRQKYGEGMVDMVPTQTGDAFLCGDSHQAFGIITKIRDAIRNKINF